MLTRSVHRPGWAACLLAAVSTGAWADLSGQKVCESSLEYLRAAPSGIRPWGGPAGSCASCHATGAANAPKYGDKAGWAKLIEEPQAQLTAHGWLGVRAMPAVGGNVKLSLEEFSRGVAFMARAAGAKWPDPDAKMLGLVKDEVIKRIEEVRRAGAKLP